MKIRFATAVSLAASLTWLLPGSAWGFAYQSQSGGNVSATAQTAYAEPVAWYHRSIIMGLDFGEKWHDHAKFAAYQWNSRANFEWVIDQGSSKPCTEDGYNNAGWGNSPCQGSWGSMAGMTEITLNRIGGQWYIGETDIVINSNLQFDLYQGPQKTDADGNKIYDFHRVLVHEFGHALGLEHPDQSGQTTIAIMNSDFMSQGIDKIQSDDIDGVRFIYSSPEPAALDLVFVNGKRFEIRNDTMIYGINSIKSFRISDSNLVKMEVRATPVDGHANYYVLAEKTLGIVPAGGFLKVGIESVPYNPPSIRGQYKVSFALVEEYNAKVPVASLDVGSISVTHPGTLSARSEKGNQGLEELGGVGSFNPALLLLTLLLLLKRKSPHLFRRGLF